MAVKLYGCEDYLFWQNSSTTGFVKNGKPFSDAFEQNMDFASLWPFQSCTFAWCSNVMFVIGSRDIILLHSIGYD